MQSQRQLQQLKREIERLVQYVPGDMFETGIKFGGTSLFIVGLTEANAQRFGKGPGTRHYYFWDSFEGFRRPQESQLDAAMNEELAEWTNKGSWAAGKYGVDDLTFVKNSFSAVGLLLPTVHFIKGYFEETMPLNKANRSIALLRMDGDLYTSTAITLQCLYPMLQANGTLVIDDWDFAGVSNQTINMHTYPCREAVNDYRIGHGFDKTRERVIKMTGTWGWRKETERGSFESECLANGPKEITPEYATCIYCKRPDCSSRTLTNRTTCESKTHSESK